MDEQIPLCLIVKELTGGDNYWCDKRLFSLINRALNLCANQAKVKIINEHAVAFSISPLPPERGDVHG